MFLRMLGGMVVASEFLDHDLPSVRESGRILLLWRSASDMKLLTK